MNSNPDIRLEMQGSVAVVRLTRPTKRNALNDGLIASLRHIFENLPKEARAAVVAGDGDHFCAGLDLSELKERDAGEGLYAGEGFHAPLFARSNNLSRTVVCRAGRDMIIPLPSSIRRTG